MSIEGFCGGLGSGKTLRMSCKLKEYFEKGFRILSNYNLNFEHKMINPLDLINGLFDDELDNSAIGLTEAYTFLDSRFSGSESSRYLTYFLLQTRKRKIKILYDAQLTGSVDIRLRGITNRIYECNKMLKDVFGDAEDINNIIGFIFHVINDNGFDYYESLDIKEAIKLFDIYNTRDILLPQYIQPTTNLKEILDIFKDCENRDTFITIMRTKNPYISYEKCRSVYSLLKVDRIKEVKEILRIK